MENLNAAKVLAFTSIANFADAGIVQVGIAQIALGFLTPDQAKRNAHATAKFVRSLVAMKVSTAKYVAAWNVPTTGTALIARGFYFLKRMNSIAVAKTEFFAGIFGEVSQNSTRCFCSTNHKIKMCAGDVCVVYGDPVASKSAANKSCKKKRTWASMVRPGKRFHRFNPSLDSQLQGCKNLTEADKEYATSLVYNPENFRHKQSFQDAYGRLGPMVMQIVATYRKRHQNLVKTHRRREKLNK